VKKIILSLPIILLGCVAELGDPGSSECQPYDEAYSHTVVHCDSAVRENAQNVFVLCNPRELEDQPEPCSDDLVLRDLVEDDCVVTNVCWPE